MKARNLSTLALFALLSAAWGPGELIPRKVLFGNPDKASPQISPDGTRLAYLAAVDGVLNVWVGPISDPSKAEPVTKDTIRGIRIYRWSFDNSHILYNQDKGGDENWHVYATNLKTKETRDLTPMPGIQARIQEVSHKIPGEILVGINDRDASLHDIYRINIATGEKKLVQKNDGYLNFLTDDDFKVRMARKATPDGGAEDFVADEAKPGEWKSWMKVPQEDSMSTEAAGFDKSGKTLYLIDSRGRDTSALVAIDIKSKEAKVLADKPTCDADDVMIHPTEHTVEAVAFNYTRVEWQFLDDKVKGDFDYLRGVASGEISVDSRSLDDKHWIVSFNSDDGPVRAFHYDRAKKEAKFLFSNRKALENLTLAKMRPLVIKARDGMNLVSFLSLPPTSDPKATGKPDKPLPMVLFVHGGPWGRDTWGLNGYHQWLANRGYAVLSVNFRSSTGFGKKFLNAGNLQWSKAMHDDLLDAVDWAVKEKVADEKKVAIMGGSYGGYATLVGLTFTPEKFACGVDIVGPSSLITLLESVPPYWKPMLDMMTAKVGDHRTEEGKKLLTAASPLTHVDKIKRPLLIAQGANDPRVKQAESDQIVKAMKEKKIPVTYVLFPDEGHGFRRPENSMAFNAVTEAFLAKHLGGRFEPIGEDFKGSRITVPEGAENVAGLKEGLATMSNNAPKAREPKLQ